ncbi:MAG TPA: patatin-like phospholipase family protein, partial [Vicinamibacteria bacterium]|nr:patatin-like phospholipase family protein [Vicinamibacteria bacterium]
MSDYVPKRRTAVVLAGSGTSGAYLAGVLKALDESGTKVDLLVGSGSGAIAAAYGAVAGGPKLYGPGGFWDGISTAAVLRL